MILEPPHVTDEPECSRSSYSESNLTVTLDLVSWIVYHTPEYLDVDQNHLYVSSNAFVIMNISDKKNPTELSHLRPLEEEWPRSLVVNGDYAYLAYGDSLIILNVTDPAAPYQVANYSVGTACNDVVVNGCYAFVVTSNSLQILEVSDPTNPRKVASQANIFSRPPTHLDVRGSYAYVACHNTVDSISLNSINRTKIKNNATK